MDTIKKATTIIALFSALFILSSMENTSFAQNRGRKHQGPPLEAYTACEGKSEGDTASFENPHGDTVTGTCVQDGDQLVLRPDNPPGRGKNRKVDD